MLSNPAVPPSKSPAWAELIQLIPIVNFALPLIIRGEVDFEHAQRAFLYAALLTLPVSALVLRRGYVLNPILLGTGIWLWLAAIAFGRQLEPLKSWLVQAQGFGLFAAIFLVGVVATFASANGYIGARCPDARWVRRTSLGLLALTAVALVWAYFLRSNIRLGGGLPFLIVNVARRATIVRAGRATAPGA
jgi:hypothetical protein